jgi:transposase InsO family protein
MSASASPATGKLYGVELVCHVGGYPRSTYYAKQKASDSAAASSCPIVIPLKRGPKTKISDDELLQHIRADLKASPWIGEGHRKVHARLRRSRGLMVGRKRILRIMRENHLLSPHRCRVANDGAHEGTIITRAPGEMVATDGTQVMTVDDGNVWVFAAVEHWNAECVGYHVAKIGNRFAALQPIAMAIHTLYGYTRPNVAHGLSLRMDHGCQYTSDDFLNQIRHWGISPSFALVGQPETNGVAERFFRTLKEQAVHGRIFRNVEELRQAIATFVETYNTAWRLEKNGYLTPTEMRQAHQLKNAA